MDVFRLLPFRKALAAENMAIDEALFREAAARRSPPTLRLYGWLKPAVSLGRFQDAGQEIDADACNRLGIEVVRRPTGGKAVLHDAEVTYSVVAGDGCDRFPPDILGTYRLISTCVAQGLKAIGIKAEMSPAGRQAGAGVSSSACFAHPSHYELLVVGRKICGAAQRRSGGSFLQHGALLLAFDAEKTAAVLPPHPDPKGWIRRLTGSVTSLGEQAPGIDGETLCRVLVEGFEQVLGVSFLAGSLIPGEEALKETLLRTKYRLDRWNLEGSGAWMCEN
ncbi:MAG: lipoate--protein ligase family protein [Syntrophaceae bacterium]|nr:lipoate--protein ligase family protein [Syntrophaceae bacterium]